MYHSRVSSTSCSFANCESTMASDSGGTRDPTRRTRDTPLVRHGNDVGVVQVRPLAIAAVPAFRGRWNLAGSPLIHSECRNRSTVCSRSCRRRPGAEPAWRRRVRCRSADRIEFIGFGAAQIDDALEVANGSDHGSRESRTQTEADSWAGTSKRKCAAAWCLSDRRRWPLAGRR